MSASEYGASIRIGKFSFATKILVILVNSKVLLRINRWKVLGGNVDDYGIFSWLKSVSFKLLINCKVKILS